MSYQLLRKQNPIQLDYADGASGGGVTLFWSNPFDSNRPIPSRSLYPVIPGGHMMDNVGSLR